MWAERTPGRPAASRRWFVSGERSDGGLEQLECGVSAEAMKDEGEE